MENHHEDLLKQQQDFERQGRHSPQGMGGGSWGNCGGVETRPGIPREELKTH